MGLLNASRRRLRARQIRAFDRYTGSPTSSDPSRPRCLAQAAQRPFTVLAHACRTLSPAGWASTGQTLTAPTQPGERHRHAVHPGHRPPVGMLDGGAARKRRQDRAPRRHRKVATMKGGGLPLRRCPMTVLAGQDGPGVLHRNDGYGDRDGRPGRAEDVEIRALPSRRIRSWLRLRVPTYSSSGAAPISCATCVGSHEGCQERRQSLHDA